MATVLIVDDVPTNLQYLTAVLVHAGHRPLQASNGAAALIRAMEDRPKLIITDITMPVMDGCEFVRRLRALPDIADTPVIFYTASYRESEARALGATCGVFHVLTKPCPPKTIIETIAAILGEPHAAASGALSAEFDRDHLRLITDTLSDKVNELKENTRVFRALSQRLLTAQEAERRRIARELHDDVGQSLALIKINLHNAGRLAGPEALAPLLHETVNLVDQVLHQIRDLSLDLRPPLLDTLGVESALRWYLDSLAQESRPAIDFSSDLEGRFSPDLEITIYRLVQEALTNAVRHSWAKRVAVNLRRQPLAVELSIQDDGIGFDVPAVRAQAARGVGMGLLGMQERAHLAGGTMEIKSTATKGTIIRVRLPAPATEGRPA